MTYDIYFHDDFDGRASAAIMLAFLKNRGDNVKRFTPLTYEIKPRWAAMRFPRPAVILDFYFHPKAAFWFDHHPTAFIKPEWKKAFRRTKYRRLDPSYASCCHLALDALRTGFGFRPPQHLRELSRWLDVIDGANYRSARQTIEAKEPALRLREFIEEKQHATGANEQIIELLSTKAVSAIIREPRIKREVALIQRKKSAALKFYRKNLRLYGRLAVIRLSRSIAFDVRFAPYYFHPQLLYALRFVRLGWNMYHIGLGANPWRRKENKIDIGRFLRERFGGGGHRDVGGAEFESRAAAAQAAREVIAFFGKKRPE